MASIYKRINKNGKGYKWRVLIRLKGHPHISETFDRREEAEDWASETERQIKRGIFNFDLHNKLFTFDELVERYINDGKLELHRSFEDTKRHLDYWKTRFGALAVVHLTPQLIGKERQHLIDTPINKESKISKRSPATVNRYISSLSSVLTYAKKLRWLEDNPCFALSKLKENNSRDRVLSIDEAIKLLNACAESNNSYLYCIVLIAITTGARKSEILNLKWNDIDFENNVAFLTRTKNNKPRVLPLVSEVIEELNILFTARDINKELVFASKTAFGKTDVKKAFALATKQAEIQNLRFHDLRHTFTTYAARQGASSLELQTATGHSTLSMLQRYTHLEGNLTRKFSQHIANQIIKK
jgi:integrase